MSEGDKLHQLIEDVKDNTRTEKAAIYQVQRNKQVATWKVDGNLPIHIACSFRSPFPLISVVIEAYTQGASVPNDSGDLPIHCVLCPVREAGLLTVVDLLKVVALLLRHHPNGAKQKNNHGNVAVHCATAHDAPMDVIKLLLKAYPEGAHQKNNNSKTPLDLAVENGASPEVVAFLQGKGIPSSEEESSSDDVKAVAALHEWIAGKEGWEVAIIRAECKRDEALIGNHHGLPIHTACSSCAPIKVIKALLQAFPDGVSYPDNYGNLPIHYAAGGDEGPLDLDVVRLLLELYPKGSALGNSYGNLPMHFAAHYKAPLEVVEALYNAYPDGLLQLNKDHETPLHIAVEKGAYDDVVAFLQGKVGEMFVSSKAVVTAEAMDQTIEEENKMLKEKEKEYKAKISELEAQLAAVYFEK